MQEINWGEKLGAYSHNGTNIKAQADFDTLMRKGATEEDAIKAVQEIYCTDEFIPAKREAILNGIEDKRVPVPVLEQEGLEFQQASLSEEDKVVLGEQGATSESEPSLHASSVEETSEIASVTTSEGNSGSETTSPSTGLDDGPPLGNEANSDSGDQETSAQV